jgi:hypothetical protein
MGALGLTWYAGLALTAGAAWYEGLAVLTGLVAVAWCVGLT